MGSYANSLQAKLEVSLSFGATAAGTQWLISFVFEAEFCPPLDPSLIAAFVYDYSRRGITQDALKSLRETLTTLSRSAEQEDKLSAEFAKATIDGEGLSTTDDTRSVNDILSTDNSPTAISTISTSDASSTGPQPFESPLGFLQTVFPLIPTHRLKSILSSIVGVDVEDIDMGDVVEHVLSAEYLRESEERGEDEGANDSDYSPSWRKAEPSKLVSQSNKKSQKKQARGTTYTLVDIRQKQHARPSSAPSTPRLPSTSSPDPWTQVSSLASRLENLIPSQSAAFFQSCLHSSKFTTPAGALRAALADISPPGGCKIEGRMLFGILEVVTSDEIYVELSEDERDQLLSDVTLALQVTGGQPDAALDLVWLLRDLDLDSASGRFEWGVYHSPVLPSPAFAANGCKKPKATLKLPAGPPPVPPPPKRQRTSPSPSPSPSPTPPPNPWKCVPPARKVSPNSPPAHAQFIPAYNSKNAPSKKGKLKGAGNGLGKGGKGDVGELVYGRSGSSSKDAALRRRVGELMQQRREAIKEASRAWQKGNKKNHGGEVAAFFAERVSVSTLLRQLMSN